MKGPKDFDSNAVLPPRLISNNLRRELTSDLKWFKTYSLSKFIFIQALGALITLLICPQFGIGPLGGGHGITHFVMKYGDFVCALFCGSVFMGTGTLLSSLLLKREEKFITAKRKLLLSFVPSFFWFLILLFMSRINEAEPMFNSTLFNLAWLFSSIFLSFILLKLFSKQWVQSKIRV